MYTCILSGACSVTQERQLPRRKLTRQAGLINNDFAFDVYVSCGSAVSRVVL